MAVNRVKESFDGCRLCVGAYKEPKLLHCLHSFCATCLDKRLQDSEFAYKIVCPTCQMETELKYSSEGKYSSIAALTTNTFIIRKQYLKGLTLQVQNHSTSTMSDSEEENPEMGSDVESGSDVMTDKMSENTDVEQSHRINVNDSYMNDDAVFLSQTANPLSPSSLPGHQYGLENHQYKMVRGELETNTMNLRMEVLNITDAIDTIDQCVKDWNHRKAELQSKIRHRSHQLQRMIVDEENRLQEQLDNFTFDREFIEEADCGKGELHSSLLSVLHAVAFARQVLVEATSEEITELAEVLNTRMKRPPINHDIVLSIPQIKFQTPNKKLTEIIKEDFGTIAISTIQRSVYSPREVTQTEEDLDSEVSTTETILVSSKDFSKIDETRNKLNTLSVTEQQRNGQQQQQKSDSDELKVSSTETILISSKDFFKIDDDITTEENRNRINVQSGIDIDWNQQQQNGQLMRLNSIDLNPAVCSAVEDVSSSSSTVSEDPLTFDRFLSLRTSLRDRRNKILRTHSGSSSPGTSLSEVNCDYHPLVMQTQSTYGSASMPKPRKRIVRHHSFNSTLRNRYDTDGSLESTPQDSMVSSTIQEKLEENSNGTDINGNGSHSTVDEPTDNYISPNSVQEYIRRKKSSWGSLSFS